MYDLNIRITYIVAKICKPKELIHVLILKLAGLNSSSYVLLNSRTDDEFNCLKCFTLKEIKKTTKNFGRDSQVSKGCVIKGQIDEHTLAPTKPGTGFAISVKWSDKLRYLGKIDWPVSVIQKHIWLGA